MKRIILIALLTNLIFSCKEKEETISTSSNSHPGQEIYLSNCATCHGKTGKGDGIARAALNPKSRNYVTEGFKYGDDVKSIKKTIMDGIHEQPW